MNIKCALFAVATALLLVPHAVAGYGDFDTAFGANGIARVDSGSMTEYTGHSIAVLPDGKILVSGSIDYVQGALVARLNPDGSLDTTFGSSGKTLLGHRAARTLRVQADGRILVALWGWSSPGQMAAVVARLDPDGSMDSSWGQGGFAVAPPEGGVVAADLALQSDGKVLVSSAVVVNSQYGRTRVLRYNTDGTLDPTFGSGGIFAYDPPGDYDEAQGGLLLSSSGRIYVTSKVATGAFAVLGLLGNGTLDPSWGVAGVAQSPFTNAQYSFISAIVEQPDGKVLTGGQCRFRGSCVERYDANGSMDATFGSGGRGDYTLHADFDGVTTMHRVEGGGILIAGFDIEGTTYARQLLEGGQPDARYFNNSINYILFEGRVLVNDSVKLADNSVIFVGQQPHPTIPRNDIVVIRLRGDATPPESTIASGPPPATSQDTATFTFAADDAGATLECSLNGGNAFPCTSPAGVSQLPEGENAFTVAARDLAGNLDPTPATWTWTVDRTAPDTSITASPPAASNTTSATFSFAATESASFECRLDGGAWAACTAPVAYAGLAQGGHTFSVRATDVVANQDATPATFAWTIDTTVPDTTITSGPSGGNNTSPVSFTFTASESGAAFECLMDGGVWTACASGVSYSVLTKGQHAFQVRARDAAGNVDASPATRNFRIK